MTFTPTVKGGLLNRQYAPNDYITVAAGQTAQVLGSGASGANGAKGNYLKRLIIIPATTGAGSVSLIDGSGGAAVTISVFVSGTLADLKPIVIDLDIMSQVGAWAITTGSNVSVIAVGVFT